jgi:pimeloyl-ACP methyl ester carboxylesterase
MGSLWTAWLSLDRPQRVATQVQVGCPALILGTSAPLPMRMMSIPSIGQLMLKLQPLSVRQVERVFAMVREDVSDIPEIRDALLACERLPDYGPSMLSLMKAVMRFGKARPEIALTREQLTQVRHPVQLIWGDRDPFGSVSVARRAAELLPAAELHVVPGGHAPWFNRADEVGALAQRFLADHPDG